MGSDSTVADACREALRATQATSGDVNKQIGNMRDDDFQAGSVFDRENARNRMKKHLKTALTKVVKEMVDQL